MRINQYLAHSSVASRRKSEQFILDGLVKVNGKVLIDLSYQVKDSDVVEFNGKVVKVDKTKLIYALNKPKGYTSTTSQVYDKKIVTNLVPKTPRVYPVGRLDILSEGLLFLTNDGDLALRISHPRNHIEKEYVVTVAVGNRKLQSASHNLIEVFKRGVEIEGKKTKSVNIEIINQNSLLRQVEFKAVLTEGHKRQIRFTVSSIGLNVVKLVRTRIGKYRLGDIQPGKYKIIKTSQIF